MRSQLRRDIKRKKKIKRGFTDRVYFLNLTLSWLFVLVCTSITVFQDKLNITNLSIIDIGIPAVFAELTVHSGFIIWKAKVENCRKYGRNTINDEINEF